MITKANMPSTNLLKTVTTRPKFAAILILYRQPSRGPLEILMGCRNPHTRFLPGVYVFPGGRVDPGDWHARAATPLRKHVLNRLTRKCSPNRARANAMAATRETFEETGLLIGKVHAKKLTRPASWQHFFETGYVPDLHRLDYIARALTPTNHPIRYDARFFITDGGLAEGKLKSNGELQDLKWLRITQAHDLPLAHVTTQILREIERYVVELPERNKNWPASFFSHRHGRFYHNYE